MRPQGVYRSTAGLSTLSSGVISSISYSLFRSSSSRRLHIHSVLFIFPAGLPVSVWISIAHELSPLFPAVPGFKLRAAPQQG
jgi:hypothetical protein